MAELSDATEACDDLRAAIKAVARLSPRYRAETKEYVDNADLNELTDELVGVVQDRVFWHESILTNLVRN